MSALSSPSSTGSGRGCKPAALLQRCDDEVADLSGCIPHLVGELALHSRCVFLGLGLTRYLCFGIIFCVKRALLGWFYGCVSMPPGKRISKQLFFNVKER
jgi:hypothetical protein